MNINDLYCMIIVLINRMYAKVKKSKKAKRTLEYIGERWHNFDFKLEQSIYYYVCCLRGRGRTLRKLDKELKFESYQEWKQYIWDKYKSVDKDKLIEFSRYLNHRIRIIKPDHEYRNIVITVILTLVFTKLAQMDLNTKINFSDISGLVMFMLGISIIIIILLLSLVIFQTFLPILNDSVEENFLKDYKEIIDEIICDKEKR